MANFISGGLCGGEAGFGGGEDTQSWLGGDLGGAGAVVGETLGGESGFGGGLGCGCGICTYAKDGSSRLTLV